MFNTTKYTRWYYNIIKNAQVRLLSDNLYTEKHHIIPRSLGGNGSKANLVHLTAREHYIVHMLLPKMVISDDHRKSMWFAAWCMLRTKNSAQGDRHLGARGKLYEVAKQHAAKASSEYWTGRKRPWTEEQREKQKEIQKSTRKYIRTPEHNELMSKKVTEALAKKKDNKLDAL